MAVVVCSPAKVLCKAVPLLVTAEIREVEGKDKTVNTILSLATAIEENWLRELFPDEISGAPRVFFDTTTKRVYAEEQLRFRDLVIGTRRVDLPLPGLPLNCWLKKSWRVAWF